MLRCVLFDIDNTLLLKKPTIPEKVFQLAAPGHPSLQMDDVEKAYAASELWQGAQIQKENETGVRMPDEEYLANVAAIYRQALNLPDEACEALTALFSRDYKKAYQLMPGAKGLLSQLKEKGLPLGIVSNNHTGVRQALEEMGIASFFSCVVLSEEAGLYKPDPQILRLACQNLGVPCEEALYVGDHPFDVLCAHAAGMKAIWLPANRFMAVPGFIGPPDYTIHTLPEAAAILLPLAGAQ